MSRHTSEHDALLEALTMGDVHGDAEVARAELEHCAICAPRMIELRALAQGLSTAGRNERSDLAQSAALADAPGSERVVDTLRKLMSSDRHSPHPSAGLRPHRGRTVALLLAAAGLLVTLVFVVSNRRGPSRDPDESTLGTPNVVLLEPRGEVEQFTHLGWNGNLPPNGRFVVRVFDALTHDKIDEHETTDLHWDPPLSESARWPRRIEWSVSIYVGKMSQWSSDRLSASRSR